MAVRRVTQHGGNVIGQFPSIKLARMVHFESLIERDLLYMLDFEADVAVFSEQPLTIEYAHEGKARRYTPDFHVIYANGRNTLIECKPQQFTETDDNQRKFGAARVWCAERDWEFSVVTDEQLRTGPRLDNIKRLTAYARHVIAPQLKQRTYALLESSPHTLTVGEVAQQLNPQHPAEVLACLWHMAFHHEVIVPLEAGPLSTQSPIRLAVNRSRSEP